MTEVSDSLWLKCKEDNIFKPLSSVLFKTFEPLISHFNYYSLKISIYIAHVSVLCGMYMYVCSFACMGACFFTGVHEPMHKCMWRLVVVIRLQITPTHIHTFIHFNKLFYYLIVPYIYIKNLNYFHPLFFILRSPLLQLQFYSSKQIFFSYFCFFFLCITT